MIEKIVLGILLAAQIGPITIEMIKRVYWLGFFEALQVRIGAVIGNFLFLLFSYFITDFLNNYSVLKIISSVGGLYLIFLSIKGFSEQNTVSSTLRNHTNSFYTGFILSLTNPISIIFWLGISASSKINTNNFIENLFVLLGMLIWSIILCYFLKITKIFIVDRYITIIKNISNLFFIFLWVKVFDKCLKFIL